MNLSSCNQEESVAQAARTGAWSDSLRSHAARCEICSEVALAAAYLCAEAQSAHTEAAPPDAGRIWRRAQLRAREEAAERALQPIAFVEKLALVLAVLFLAGFFLQGWPRVNGWLEGFAALSARAATLAGTFPSNPLMITGAGLFLLLPPLLFALYVAWSEE